MESNKQWMNYVIWQNRAMRFYPASRLLHFNNLLSASKFCGFQAIETLLKGTVIHFDTDYNSKKQGGHKIKSIKAYLNQLVPKANAIEIPEYIYFEERYQILTRYPIDGKGIIAHPEEYLKDLDGIIVQLLALVPQKNACELHKILKNPDNPHYAIIREYNDDFEKFLRLFGFSPQSEFSRI